MQGTYDLRKRWFGTLREADSAFFDPAAMIEAFAPGA